MSIEPMITAQEVADKLGVSVYTIHRLKFKPGGLKAYRVGRCVRFKPDEVNAYIAAQAVEAVQPTPGFAVGRFQYKPGMKVVSL